MSHGPWEPAESRVSPLKTGSWGGTLNGHGFFPTGHHHPYLTQSQAEHCWVHMLPRSLHLT